MLPNVITGLFLIPPYDDNYHVLRQLILQLKAWSTDIKPVKAYEVLPYELDHYNRNGFYITRCRKCLIRPTDRLAYTFSEKYYIAEPTKERTDDMANLLYKSFFGQRSNEGLRTLVDHKEAIDKFFARNEEHNLLNKASVLLFDIKSNQLIGLCLVVLNSGLPLVYFTAVDPNYRGQGLAKGMLSYSISAIHDSYPLIKLYVTCGNNAENLYFSMGFMPGIKQYIMQLGK